MKKVRWIILILLVLGIVCYGFSHKPLPTTSSVQYAKMLNEKGSYEVATQKVKYYEQTEGFLAKPIKTDAYPGVVMIHERWGLNNNIRDMAKLLASFGYSVLAVDLYNGSTAKTAQEAQTLIGSLDQEKAILNLRAAAEYLRKNEKSVKVASLGWNFGGGQSLKLALSGEKLDATVIYYGDLLLDTKKISIIKGPVLVIFGEKDIAVPVTSARIFCTILTKLKTPCETQIYQGVGHDFANPSDPSYAPDETADAWTKTVEFLEKTLKK